MNDSEAAGIEAGTGRTLNAAGRDLTRAAYAARDHGTATLVSIGGRHAAAVVPLDTGGHPRRRPADDGAECVITLASGRTIRTDSYQASPPGSSYARVCEPDGTEIGYWDSAEWQEAPLLVMAAILGAARGDAGPLCAPGQVTGDAPAAGQDAPGSTSASIRAGGEPPPRTRESQPRAGAPAPRYTARFAPETWQNDQAVPADPRGPQEWDCTAFASLHHGYVHDLAACGDLAAGVTDNDDLFRRDPAAPPWIKRWAGPFTITIRRED